MSKRDWLSVIFGWLVGVIAWQAVGPSPLICGGAGFAAAFLARWFLGYFL